MVSTLDIITNGRVELGIGAGWDVEEYTQYGYEFPSAVARVVQLDEAVSILKEMWVKQKDSFKGKYYSIHDAICNPKPIQNPYPTIMMGGSGEKYPLKVAAKHADGYNHPCGTAGLIKRKISKLQEHCATIARNPKEIECSILISCLIGEGEKEVKEIIDRRVVPNYFLRLNLLLLCKCGPSRFFQLISSLL